MNCWGKNTRSCNWIGENKNSWNRLHQCFFNDFSVAKTDKGSKNLEARITVVLPELSSAGNRKVSKRALHRHWTHRLLCSLQGFPSLVSSPPDIVGWVKDRQRYFLPFDNQSWWIKDLVFFRARLLTVVSWIVEMRRGWVLSLEVGRLCYGCTIHWWSHI